MYHFRDQILSGNPELFFVMNCDVCGDFPLFDMLEFHVGRGKNSSNFTILATEVFPWASFSECFSSAGTSSLQELSLQGHTQISCKSGQE